MCAGVGSREIYGAVVSRTSADEYRNGVLWNGYDYTNQAWVVDGKYVRCGHQSTGPYATACTCYGRMHEGEDCKEVGTSFTIEP